MSELKHTKEPWHIPQAWAGFSEIRGADGQLVFGLAAGNKDERASSEVCEANAKRLTDCVNALAGIPDPVARLAWLEKVAEVFREIAPEFVAMWPGSALAEKVSALTAAEPKTDGEPKR